MAALWLILTPASASATIFPQFELPLPASTPCIAGTCRVTIHDISYSHNPDPYAPPDGPYTWQADFHREAHPSFTPETPAMAPGSSYTYTYAARSDYAFHHIQQRIVENGQTFSYPLGVGPDLGLVQSTRSARNRGGRCRITETLTFDLPGGTLPVRWEAAVELLRTKSHFGRYGHAKYRSEAKGSLGSAAGHYTLSATLTIPDKQVERLRSGKYGTGVNWQVISDAPYPDPFLAANPLYPASWIGTTSDYLVPLVPIRRCRGTTVQAPPPQ